MKTTQLSIFLENRSGRLEEVLGVLTGAHINIRALSLADTADFGILRLIVDRPADGLATLQQAGCTVVTTDVLAVEVPDCPGGLHSILHAISSANINVEYMYAFVTRKTDKAIVVFRFPDTDAAIAALRASGISILPPATVYELCAP